MDLYGSVSVLVLCFTIVRAQKAGEICVQPELRNGEFRYWYMFPLSTFREIEYTCDVNYVPLNGSSEYGIARCTENGWDPKPRCIGKPCGSAPVVENANTIKVKINYLDGESATYECKTDYVVVEHNKANCQDGQWIDIPKCVFRHFTFLEKEDKCGAAIEVKNGEVRKLPLFFSHKIPTAVYSCQENYVLDGKHRIECRNGEWEDPPVCMRKSTLCSSPITRIIKHGEYTDFKCLSGYEIFDERLLRVKCVGGILLYPTCTLQGQWKSCGNPPAILYGDTLQPLMKRNPHGTVMDYICPEYYVLEGNPKVKCRDGKWEEPPVCMDPCTVTAHIMKTNNIKLKWVSHDKIYIPHGEGVEFSCLDGYELSDGNLLRVTCNRGILSYPICTKPGQREGCGSPPVILNGDTVQKPSSFHAHGAVLEYKCINYYVLEGKNRITCKDGKWDNVPACIDPCTVTAHIMKTNNIKLKWVSRDILFIPHGEDVEFSCLDGYELSDGNLLRVTCNRGILSYPVCTKPG
ncbi:hypothetical protein GDO86_016554 [Hymenochirus boettgeri]|uniref:Sushi domain-containing protein n=1 Tax=Hymenochirus boettgeri TaxID=247094 RepID=A0A8T2K2U1_9PIPI|nr:hypothetical protein GDO86_016554 [Hymenochirus boettgeri]